MAISHSRTLSTSILTILLSLPAISTPAVSASLESFRASPDQVLVLYNADWEKDIDDSEPGQDSKEVAEYYAAMHTDAATGKKPYILGLACRHRMRGSHLNHWFIKEDSNDNANGVVFIGKGASPKGEWIRDSRKVEIKVDDPAADWDSVSIVLRSETTGEEKTFSHAGKQGNEEAVYHTVRKEKGKIVSFDASLTFAGPVTVLFRIKNATGETIRDLSLRYWDIEDFEFSPTGHDGIADDRAAEDDILTPVRNFLEDPANVLPDGTLLRDHILYIVLVHGMPYSAKAVWGIEHGATPRKGDHGSLASLEQRLQTLYYAWDTTFRPPVISMFMSGGPDSEKGVVNHVVTTGMRNPQFGWQWNPYLHPDTHSFLAKKRKPPVFLDLAPLGRRRAVFPRDYFIYSATRIDGADAREAKRIIDYSLYATRYLRPEMDCRVRADLAARGKTRISNLEGRLRQAEEENLWGEKEMERLGFIVDPKYDQGVPLLERPEGEPFEKCRDGKADWKVSGFYPGGMGRHVISHNGLNSKSAPVWEYIGKGVTVTAAGAPAYSGGPHITNATFWDNRILTRYLYRGRDLGEALLISTYYVNWSTSLIGDPLMHPDLRKTIIDESPPVLRGDLSVRFEGDAESVTAFLRAELAHSADMPEVAMMKVTLRDGKGDELTGATPLYSARPVVVIKGLRADTEYTAITTLIDPYGNRAELPEQTVKTEPEKLLAPLKKLFRKLTEEPKTHD